MDLAFERVPARRYVVGTKLEPRDEVEARLQTAQATCVEGAGGELRSLADRPYGPRGPRSFAEAGPAREATDLTSTAAPCGCPRARPSLVRARISSRSNSARPPSTVSRAASWCPPRCRPAN
jgi:hypothetical protein